MASDRPMDREPSKLTGHWRCKVCLRSLNVEGSPSGEERLVHGPLPPAIPAHEPVPEQIEDQFDIVAVCDFCSRDLDPGEEWTIPAESFTYDLGPGVPLQNSVGGWAACTACVEDYNADRFEAIARRWVEYHDYITGQRSSREQRRSMKRSAIGFWKALKRRYALGPPERQQGVMDGQSRASRHEFRLP